MNRFAQAIVDGVTLAAAEILSARGIDPATRIDAMVLAVRREAVTAANALLDDGKALVDAGRSPWLTELFKAECAAAGRRVADEVA